jgi:hypothetical protein
MLSIPLPPIDLVIPIRYATCAFVSPARFGVGNALGVSTSQPHQEDQPMYVIIAPSRFRRVTRTRLSRPWSRMLGTP